MLDDNAVFLLALVFFAASGVVLATRGAVISHQFAAATTFVITGVLALFPQLYYTSNRQYELAPGTQWIVLGASFSFFVSVLFFRRPARISQGVAAGWRGISLRRWLFIGLAVCVADPVVSLLLHGQVGLVAGNQGMGLGGGDHTQVFTPLTYVAWAVAAGASILLATDYAFNSDEQRDYWRHRRVELLIVCSCLMLASLSGNRFVMLSAAATAFITWAMVGRLSKKALLIGVVGLVAFFVMVGEFRFGAVDIARNLSQAPEGHVTRLFAGWFASYLEPVFPNLDMVVRHNERLRLGVGWASSVLPSGVLAWMDIERVNAALWLANESLYVYHGLTFRTMYADLIMDWGAVGAVVFGALFFGVGVYSQNRAFRSPRRFAFFLAFGTLVLWSPLLAGFYGIQNLVLLATPLLIKKTRATGERKPAFTEIHATSGVDEKSTGTRAAVS